MAYSPSTGHHAGSIYREQFTTGDQAMVFSSGSRLILQSGARMEDENITTVTTSGVYGTTVPSRGLVYLAPASSGNITVQLAAPDHAGQRVQIILANSSKKKGRIISGNTAVTIAGTSGQMLTLTTEATFKPYATKGYGRTGVSLVALTTAKWQITAPQSTLTGFLDLSSARSS